LNRDLFSENLQSLRKRDSILAERVEKSLFLAQRIEILPSKKGAPTARMDGILLHSSYDPFLEANRMVDKFELKDKELIIVFGFGLGHHVIEIAKRMDQGTELLVIEPHLDLFRAALKRMDLAFLFENERVRFSIGEDISGLANLFNDEKVLSAHLLLIEHSPSAKLSQDHSLYINHLLSGNQTHLKKRLLLELNEDDLLQLLIEGLFFKNWPNQKIKLRNIFTTPKPEYKRILLIQLASIGDVVYTTPVFSGLKERFKGAECLLLTERLTAPLVKFDPHLDGIITFDKTGFLQKLLGRGGRDETKRELKEFIQGVKDKEFDLVVNLHTSPRSAVLTNMIAKREIWGLTLDNYGQPCVIGHPWMHYRYWTMKEGSTGGLGITELHLLMTDVEPPERETAIYINEDSNRRARRSLVSVGIHEEEGFIGLFPGSNYPSRRWPEENFAVLANLIQKKLKTKVVIFGGVDDLERANRILRLMNIPSISLAGKTSLLELAALLKRCNLFITNDTGPLHIACAVKTPTITLAGPAWIGPYGPGHFLLVSKLPCIGCPKFTCQDHTCMTLITPEAVLISIEILRELRKEVRDEALIKRLLSLPPLQKIEILYSGDKPPGKLFALAPLMKVRSTPEIIKEVVVSFAGLNVWGIKSDREPRFSGEEILKRIEQDFLIEHREGLIRELKKTSQDLKELQRFCQEGSSLSGEIRRGEEGKEEVFKKLSQIRYRIRSLPIFSVIEYLSPALGVDSNQEDSAWELYETALATITKIIDNIIELV